MTHLSQKAFKTVEGVTPKRAMLKSFRVRGSRILLSILMSWGRQQTEYNT